MAITRTAVALLTATLITFGSLAGEAKGGTILHDPFRYFQHQEGTMGPDDPFMGVCYTAAGYNTMLGIVDAGHGTWIAGTGGTEAYGTSIADKYNKTLSNTEHKDGNDTNEHTSWRTANENFVADYLKAPIGFYYKTVDYALGNFGMIDLVHAIGAMALVDRVDIPDVDLEAAEWWLNFHVVSLFDLDLAKSTVKFTDSNIDKAGKEYTDKAGAELRQDFQYGILEGGGQTLSWNVAGIIQNADGTNMDDELLESIRVIYMYAVPEPSSLALAGLGGIGLAIAAYRRRLAA